MVILSLLFECCLIFSTKCLEKAIRKSAKMIANFNSIASKMKEYKYVKKKRENRYGKKQIQAHQSCSINKIQV